MNRRILVVEDDAIQADSIAYLLKMRGYNSRSVLNGEAALSVLTANTFDLLLIDLYMPGIDGVELIKKLREVKHTAVPVVLMTAADTDTIRNVQLHSESLQPLVILQKPFTMDVLISTLTKFCPSEQTNEDGKDKSTTPESVLSPMPTDKL